MIDSKKILLTGGTGLIGGSITKTFREEGHKLKIISRTNHEFTYGVQWILFDLASDKLLDSNYFNEVDVIVHNAASLKAGISDVEISELESVNVSFTRKLLDKAVEAGVKRVIFTSSISVISKPLPDIISEESELAPATPYAVSKLAGENLIQTYAHKFGFKYNILRISSPVADHFDLMPQTVIKKWIESAVAGNDLIVFGSGKRSQNFVAVSDVVNTYLKCLDTKAPSGIFNIASPDLLSMKELSGIIANKWNVGVRFSGEDANENDHWNISVDKAMKLLDYHPEYNSRTSIFKLLESCKF